MVSEVVLTQFDSVPNALGCAEINKVELFVPPSTLRALTVSGSRLLMFIARHAI